MKATLKSLRETKANPAVSIFVKTHREHPANEKDPIALKNQLKVVEERLTNEYDKQTASAILKGIHAKTDDLNHNYNLDTLAIFASTEDVQVIRMPLDTTERVVISDSFATRDLVRDMASAVHFYTVVLTRDVARLIEASNDRVVAEFIKIMRSKTIWKISRFLSKIMAYIPQVMVALIVHQITKAAISKSSLIKSIKAYKSCGVSTKCHSLS